MSIKEYYHHSHPSHGIQAYGVGLMLAAGIEFATSHDWFSTLWHALLSWISVGYHIADTLQHIIK
ncbi:hypothetical protein KIJ05_04805 [Leuconostoc gelidum subsp. gasicomitatum]|uniref:hypothetical protein n=1 Tax=Leuconostoc gasicomitatum TaxID=115778 RepID=UPI001CC7EC3F|nr:hypothetical protein [Leuconostoc gasicomitatum]MBZ5984450.1 hypothetical protein [Leuconostoc gasicomitatum]